MTLNDNFVVQRYFNVKGYNPKARKSVELYSLIRDVAEKIQEDLKKRWAATSPTEAEFREELYMELLGSLSFERKLKAILNNGLIKR